MKKIFCLLTLLLFLIPLFPLHTAKAEESSFNYFVSANSCVLFAEADFKSEKLTILKHGTELKLEMDGDRAKTYTNDNYSFYRVLNFDDKTGYVLSELVFPISNQISSIPSFNAKTNINSTVFWLENDVYVESEIELEKGTRIFLYEGYKSKTEYTAIAFIHENEVVYGYLQTKNINPDGINVAIIYAIIIIVALLGIIFAWLFAKKRKTKIKNTKIKIKTN